MRQADAMRSILRFGKRNSTKLRFPKTPSAGGIVNRYSRHSGLTCLDLVRYTAHSFPFYGAGGSACTTHSRGELLYSLIVHYMNNQVTIITVEGTLSNPFPLIGYRPLWASDLPIA